MELYLYVKDMETKNGDSLIYFNCNNDIKILCSYYNDTMAFAAVIKDGKYYRNDRFNIVKEAKEMLSSLFVLVVSGSYEYYNINLEWAKKFYSKDKIVATNININNDCIRSYITFNNGVTVILANIGYNNFKVITYVYNDICYTNINSNTPQQVIDVNNFIKRFYSVEIENNIVKSFICSHIDSFKYNYINYYDNLIIDLSKKVYYKANNADDLIKCLSVLKDNRLYIVVCNNRITQIIDPYFSDINEVDYDYFNNILYNFIIYGLYYYSGKCISNYNSYRGYYESNEVETSLDYDYISSYMSEYGVLNRVSVYIDNIPFKQGNIVKKGGENNEIK